MVREVIYRSDLAVHLESPKVLPAQAVAVGPDFLPTAQDLVDVESESAAILHKSDEIILGVDQRDLDLLLKDSLGLTLAQLRQYTVPTAREYEDYKLLYWRNLFHKRLCDKAIQHEDPNLVAFHENQLATLASQIKLFQNDKMVVCNWRLAFGAAIKFWGWKEDLSDVFQEGMVGLMQAATTYNPFMGSEFSTWAYWPVRGRVFDFISYKTGVSPRQRKRMDGLRQLAEKTGSTDLYKLAIAKLRQTVRNFDKLEKGVQDYKIKVQMKRLQDLRDLEKITNAVSLDKPVRNKDGVERDTLLDLIPDVDADPVDIVVRADLAWKMKQVLGTLTPREQKVLRSRFGFEGGKRKTAEEVSGVLGISRQRVDAIEKRALEKLRYPISDLLD